WDQDRSPASRALLDAFWSSGYFTPVATLAAPDEVRAALDRGDAEVVLVVPAGFAADVGAGRPATVQALVDGSDANSATIGIGYARAIVLGHGARLRLRDAGPSQ